MVEGDNLANMPLKKLLLATFALFASGVFILSSAQDESTIDATAQRQRPPRGRGPFPGSASPGYSAVLPIRLQLLIPSGEMRSDRKTFVDFVITNIGAEPIKLPCSFTLFNSEP